jgi:hypothetical protein
MQREAPACRLRSLFEQNDVLQQVFTVAVIDGVQVTPGDTLHATVVQTDGQARFTVTNLDGRRAGAIAGESGRVLAETLRENQLTTVSLRVDDIIPVCGDAQVRILPE